MNKAVLLLLVGGLIIVGAAFFAPLAPRVAIFIGLGVLAVGYVWEKLTTPPTLGG